MVKLSLLLVASVTLTEAWAPKLQERVSLKVPTSVSKQPSFDPFNLASEDGVNAPFKPSPLLVSSAALLATPSIASAATVSAPSAVASALAAYGHYISLIGLVVCLMVERLTIKPNMSDEEEDLIAIADTLYGLFAVFITYTGYLRLTAYEKGLDFYLHEPFFWLKMTFLGIFGASSFFNTTKIIQRAIAKRNGTMEPMGEKLAARMIQICNAELTAIAIIPLTASFMARGVGYSNSIPWQVEAGATAAIFAGLSFKYIKEALTFEE
jgi:putative membrane protein